MLGQVLFYSTVIFVSGAAAAYAALADLDRRLSRPTRAASSLGA